ncbi:hypothetical protein HU200_039947 [Digitaria exilis]|uniref:BPM/SPOP BACK domain-containing protein n=1 Tax=Digitaria exilis TaxID=1010633 RepID=A0A835B6X4_9POAL|nr:hypothetical protein HU200_039947 [Digitaria exilis]
MREAGIDLFVIQDMLPDVFRTFLYFIYNDSLPPLDDLEADNYDEMIRHLLVVADRYAMERLKLMCQSILCGLKDACIEFITSSTSMDAVVATQGYKNLKRTSPSVAFEVLEKKRRIHKD